MSVIRRPLSSSWARSSIESKSPRSSPLFLRSAITARRIRSNRRIARSTRMFIGVGIQCGRLTRLAVLHDEGLHERIHRRAHLGGIAADLRVEKRLGDDLERQPHHVILRVANLPVGPAAKHALRELNHQLAITPRSALGEKRAGQAFAAHARTPPR